MPNEEEKYYSLTKRIFGILAPFYDTVTAILSFGLMSKIRDRVVTFTNAGNGSRILDVATGTGQQAMAFAKKGYKVTGIDLSEAMLKVADRKNKYSNAKFKLADATRLPFEDDSFDVACVSFGLHDMPLSIREKALKEMVRVTRGGGTVVVVDYALPKNHFGNFFFYHLIKLYERGYYPEFIRSDLKALIGKAGIKITNEIPVLFGAAIIIKGEKIG